MIKNILMNKTKRESNFNGYSYVAHLAAMGNDTLVNEGIEESPLAIYQAIYGYGVAANIKAMETLISDSQDKTKAMKMAIRGLVRGNHLEELDKISDYRNNKADIIFGLAQDGNEAMVARMVNKEPAFFGDAVQGYASVSNEKVLLNLLKGTHFYGEAIFQAARDGHKNLVNQLLKVVGFGEDLSGDYKEKIRILGFLNTALSGYCKGFHLEAASDLLTKGANIQTALDALKVGGKPCLDAYMGLYIVSSDANSRELLDKIKIEFTLDDASLSAAQVETMQKLQGEYRKWGATFVSFLSGTASSEEVNVIEQLDDYFIPRKRTPSTRMF